MNTPYVTELGHIQWTLQVTYCLHCVTIFYNEMNMLDYTIWSNLLFSLHDFSELFILNHIIWKHWEILSHSWSPFLPLNCLYRKKWTFVGLCATFWSIFLRKNSTQITHANHMTMTTSRQILSWSDHCKTKENVNITLLDLCLFTF